MKKIIHFLFFLAFFFLVKTPTFAHEAYVLSQKEFQEGLKITSSNTLAPLIDPSHLQLFLIISLCVGLIYAVSILWSTTSIAGTLDKKIKKLSVLGPLTIRIVVGVVFLASALSNTIFGPEISLSTIPFGEIIRILLFILSAMLFTGFLVEVAGIISLLIFIYLFQSLGIYMVTYSNYLGEILVIILFGSRLLSLDKLFFGQKLWIKGIEKFKGLEVPIVRMLYGVALMYAAFSIKFQHQSIPIEVYNQYHLKQFFKESASFIAAGAGLSELMIGAFIFFGFALRLTIILSLIFITLSLMYFGEIVWPHLMLYGISFSLIINSGDKFTVDKYFIPFVGRTINKLRKSTNLI